MSRRAWVRRCTRCGVLTYPGHPSPRADICTACTNEITRRIT